MPKLIHITFFIALFLIFLLPPTDPDLGWQLRCGELFWKAGSFCKENQFTVLLPDYSWPNHGWGYQALIYPVYKFFGLYGLTVLNALLMTTAFGFLFAAIRNHTLEKMLGILATIYLGWGVFSFGLRSQLFGFFFFNLTLYLLTKLERNKLNPRPLLKFVLPLVMLFWANTHGSVILGLILIFLFNLYAAVVKINRNFPACFLPVTSIASALATLINPFGFRIYEEMWRHFAGPIDLSQLIAEWVPPQPHIQQIILVSGAVVVIYLVYRALSVETPRRGVSTLLLIPVFAFLALKARRNVPFYFVVLTYSLLNSLKPTALRHPPSLLRSFGGTGGFGRRPETFPLRNQPAILLTVGVLLYGLLVQLPQTIETNSSWQNYCQNKSLTLPCEAVEFLKTQGPGNIFNRYEWGGFLVWQLPEYKIFVDGRMPAWVGPENKSPYTIYLETLQTQPDWQETLAQYDITYILISPGTFMDLKLEPNPASFGWQKIFRDKISVIYKKV
jgi:hypothetical protein